MPGLQLICGAAKACVCVCGQYTKHACVRVCAVCKHATNESSDMSKPHADENEQHPHLRHKKQANSTLPGPALGANAAASPTQMKTNSIRICDTKSKPI